MTRFRLGLLGGALCLVAVLATQQLAPRGLPWGIVVLGLLVGSLNGLVAIGLVLVYRAGKYVNFAQGGLGAAGAVIAGKLIFVEGFSYWVAAPIGIASAMALAYLAEVIFIRRLFRSPRLILTVATIGLAQLFGGFETGIAAVWQDPQRLPPRLDVPIDAHFSIGEVVFGGEHVMVLVAFPLVALGLTALFKLTDFGAAVQAAAENADRARLLGISVRRVSTVVWLIAGGLAGLTAILQAPIVGFSFGSGAGPDLLLRALAPAMIAGLSSLSGAVVAALALGVLEQAIAWNVDIAGPVNAALFGVILLTLLVRRHSRGRTTESEERSFAASSAIRPFPRELAVLPRIQLARACLWIVGAAVVLGLPLLLSISQRNLASLVLVYVLAGSSLTVLSGFAGQVSFGNWAIVGFGALFGGWLVTAQGVAPLSAGILTVCAGTGVGLLVALPALRIRGLFLGVTTLAFAVACSSYFFTLAPFQLEGVAERGEVLGVDLESETAFYYLCLAVTTGGLLLVRNLRTGRWGRNFIAIRDNDRAGISYGIDPVLTKLAAFGVSGFLASLAGFLYLFAARTVNGGAFPVETSLLLFSAVVIGGLGSVSGAVIGALYLRGISFFAPSLQLFSTSLGLLLVLCFFPGGLGALLFRGRDVLLRALALRWGVHVPSLLADSRQPDPRDVGGDLPGLATDERPLEVVR